MSERDSQSTLPTSKDVGPWPELDVFQQEAMRDKARPRIASKVEAYGHMSDEWVANRVRMLYRDDLEHEPVCSAARDRIMRLSIQLAEARGVIDALKARNGESQSPDETSGCAACGAPFLPGEQQMIVHKDGCAAIAPSFVEMFGCTPVAGDPVRSHSKREKAHRPDCYEEKMKAAMQESRGSQLEAYTAPEDRICKCFAVKA